MFVGEKEVIQEVYIEGDDGTTDTDDTDSTIDWAENTFATFRIDATNLSAVKFYVDDVLVPTTISIPLCTSTQQTASGG